MNLRHLFSIGLAAISAIACNHNTVAATTLHTYGPYAVRDAVLALNRALPVTIVLESPRYLAATSKTTVKFGSIVIPQTESLTFSFQATESPAELLVRFAHSVNDQNPGYQYVVKPNEKDDVFSIVCDQELNDAGVFVDLPEGLDAEVAVQGEFQNPFAIILSGLDGRYFPFVSRQLARHAFEKPRTFVFQGTGRSLVTAVMQMLETEFQVKCAVFARQSLYPNEQSGIHFYDISQPLPTGQDTHYFKIESTAQKRDFLARASFLVSGNIVFEEPEPECDCDVHRNAGGVEKEHRGGVVECVLDGAASQEEIAATILRRLNQSNSSTTHSITFDESDLIFLPYTHRDGADLFKRSASLLSTFINFDHPRGNLGELLESLCEQVGEANGAIIRIGSIPENTINQELFVNAENVTAAALLIEIGRRLGNPLFWSVAYDFENSTYELNAYRSRLVPIPFR